MKFKNKVTLYDVISGSRAYGTARPDSDYDYRTIYTLELQDILDPFQNEEIVTTINDEVDQVDFELRKFFALAAQSNPNIIELLFLPKECARFVHPAFERIVLDNKQAFLSKEARNRFAGYMRGQLARMELHRAWFKDPPTAPPEREDYGVPSFLTNEQVVQLVSMPNDITSLIVERYGSTMERWQDFLNAKKRWQNYQRWLKERNPARAELERNFGYDTKHASHLVRLGFEAMDIFTEGTIHIPSKNLETIRDVKNGKWTAEQVVAWAEEMFEKVNDAADKSTLPAKADRKTLRDMYAELMKAAL